MDVFVNSVQTTDMTEVSSYEDYEHLKAKQRASVLWLLSKVFNNDIPYDLRDPFYKDHDEQDRLKPQITQSLANAELYCLALANIYSDPNYHCLNHHGIMQILMRKGVYMVEPHDASLTETVLIQIAPIKMSAHMVIIEGIMTLYIKEVLIPEKVAEVVSRYAIIELPEEIPEDPEEAALFWINKSCVMLKQIMQRDINEDETTRNEPTPTLPMLEDLTDMSDGCCLAALLSFYCPDHLRWQEICLNKDMSMADSIYNLQLVQFFCQEKLPYNICFLSLEDFLYLHETIQPNVLAFIADLLFLFEIKPALCVRQPGVDYENHISSEDDINQNGSALSYPNLPTPAEMKAKSLQHSSWVDERQQHLQLINSITTPPTRPTRKSRSSAKVGQINTSSYNVSDEDEELTRYFSALDIKTDIESSPEILMIAERKPHKSPVKTGSRSITSYSNNIRDYNKDNNLDSDELNVTNSPNKHLDSSSNGNNKSYQLSDYFTQLAQTNSNPPKKLTPNTTSFTKLNSENSNNNNNNNNTFALSPEPAINIAYMQKSEKSSSNGQGSGSGSGSPLKSQSARSIPHMNSVMQLLEDNEIASQVYNIRMKLEEKRRQIEQERKSAEEEWKSNRQNIGKEAFLRVVHKNGKTDHESNKQLVSQTPFYINSEPIVSMPTPYVEYDKQQVYSSPTNKPFIGRTFRISKSKEIPLSPDISGQSSPTRSVMSEFSNESINNGNNGKVESSSSSSTTKEYSNVSESGYPNESFFISFGSNAKPKTKPGLKPKQVKLQQQMRRELKSANAVSNASAVDIPSQENSDQNNSTYMNEISKESNQTPNSVSPGVGFIIGTDLAHPDPITEEEMAKKKETIMINSLKRRTEQEAKRLKKEQELAQKRDEERLSRENSEKKKEEERVKRHLILEQYRQRKAAEEAEKNVSNYSSSGSKDSAVRSNSTLVLNRPPRQRLFQTGKPRPKSLHVSASNIQDYSSLDCKPSRLIDETDSCQNMLSSNCNSSRPQSAMSGQSTNSAFSVTTARRLPSPTQTHPLHVPSYSTSGYILSRIKGPPSDGASDVGSIFSEYSGPKLFVKPSQKSNKVLILNAINVVLAGAVNSDTKKKVLEEINRSDSKHYLILFRNAGLQFRALYTCNADREEVHKLFGTGPKTVINEMIDRFYKYNSGSKCFTEIQTKHLSATIDAFIIHNDFWTGKRVITKKDYL